MMARPLMPRFSTVFRLSNSQANLDFVDIELTTDNPLFVDPYAIQIREDEWSSQCGDHIRSFFGELLDALRAGNSARANLLLSNLHEPNETCLGVSSGKPDGRGVGEEKARSLMHALRSSRAFRTGLIRDISEAELFIRGVGRDTISDLTTNILRGLLADYTRQQCELQGVPIHRVMSLPPCWNMERLEWESRVFELPLYERRPILLVPKFSVRRQMSLVSHDFWNYYMIEFLQEEYLNARSSLVRVLKNGEPRVYKKHVKERHPFDKDALASFTESHPELLQEYKDLQGSKPPLEPSEIYHGFNERRFASAMQRVLPTIPLGGNDATRYHHFITGVCTFLFYPDLIYPVKEFEIHEGRKRIDIKFTNAAEGGFFHTMIRLPQTRAQTIPMECKNYTKEINNPELDQLSGRFSVRRGYLGFLLCRSLDDRQRFIKRCRDTTSDGRGYIIVFEDSDILTMLNLIEQGQRKEIDRFLTHRFDEIAA